MNKLLWILGTFLLLTQHLYADSPAAPIDYTMEEYNQFQVVFEGKPVEIKDYSNQYQIVVFEVEKVYRGVLEGERLEVYTPAVHCSNSNVREREVIQFEMEQVYLVFAYKENGFILTSRSTGTALVSSFEYREREQARKRVLYKQEKLDNKIIPDRILKLRERRKPVYTTPYELVRQADTSQNEYSKYYNLEGIVTAEGRLQEGVPVGEWMYYNSKGSLKSKGCYEHGIRDGEWVEYPFMNYLGIENKTRMWKRKYVEKKEAEFIEYNEDKLIGKTVFNFSNIGSNIECTVIHEKLFYKPCECEYQQVHSIYYSIQGRMKEERSLQRISCEMLQSGYIRQVNQINTREYYPSQELKIEGSYEYFKGVAPPKKIGMWKYYDKNGQLIKMENFDNK